MFTVFLLIKTNNSLSSFFLCVYVCAVIVIAVLRSNPAYLVVGGNLNQC